VRLFPEIGVHEIRGRSGVRLKPAYRKTCSSRWYSTQTQGPSTAFGYRLHSARDDRGLRVADELLLAEFFEGDVIPVGDVLRVAPAGVAVRDHYVEDPLMALFFRFDQAEGGQVEEVALHEVDLLF